MYCPKCDKTIEKERLEEVNRQLKGRFKNDSLEKGKCPVCSTELIDLDNARK
jgi:ssDNA-binding Zn-finger/Zn-ribbon topoisomerase 1